MFRRDARESEAPRLEDFKLTDPSAPSRSCCCLARPAVKVIMPPTAGREHSVDLWLCGHHYRASLAALMAAGARVEDLTMADDSLLPDRVSLPAQSSSPS